MINIGKIGKIIIPDNMKKHIDFLHNSIGRTEWSGILFYKHTSGKIGDFKDLVFEAIDLFLMDIGTSGYTSFEYDKDIIQAYDNIPESMECLTGLIHTH